MDQQPVTEHKTKNTIGHAAVLLELFLLADLLRQAGVEAVGAHARLEDRLWEEGDVPVEESR